MLQIKLFNRQIGGQSAPPDEHKISKNISSQTLSDNVASLQSPVKDDDSNANAG